MISETILKYITYTFDPLHAFWENNKTHKRVAALMIAIFIVGLAGIELNRQGMLPPEIGKYFYTNHYHAISVAFTFVLILEVISLIFTLPCSISRAVGKQFEILALILLRSSFKELANFPEPITLEGHMDSLYYILADCTGALAIFSILGVYYKIQKKRSGHYHGATLYNFVTSKKLVALIMLGLFGYMGFSAVYGKLIHSQPMHFFADFYTVLIFSDILIVLISQRFQPSFHAVFRNSGFAVSTLLIRLALTAPPYYNAIIGVIALLFAVFLTLAYDYFYMEKA
ncbi:MAG: hypothetical protein ACNI27_10055 [Desulfovibrio sp.]